jgi:acetyl/propionyl-CoA carboxylase alpha subunit
VIRYRCGDDTIDVLVRESKAGTEVSVNGAAFALDVQELAAGTYLLRNGGCQETFHCVADGRDVYLFWRGVAYRLEVADQAGPAAHRHVSGALETPMPGKVIKVSVSPGERVTKGQEILVVEAMKMENAIRAPRDGTVKSVAARVGEMVAPGVVLAELE